MPPPHVTDPAGVVDRAFVAAASLHWLVKGLICLFFILAWPIAKLLDFLFGEEHGITRYRPDELSAFIQVRTPPLWRCMTVRHASGDAGLCCC